MLKNAVSPIPVLAISVQCRIQYMWNCTYQAGLFLFGFLLQKIHVCGFPLWLWKCLFKVVHVSFCVCVQGFYVHDLIPQWAKILQWWLCGRVYVCAHACVCVIECAHVLPPPLLPCKADSEHTQVHLRTGKCFSFQCESFWKNEPLDWIAPAIWHVSPFCFIVYFGWTCSSSFHCQENFRSYATGKASFWVNHGL